MRVAALPYLAGRRIEARRGDAFATMTAIKTFVILAVLLWGGCSVWKAAFPAVPRASMSGTDSPPAEAVGQPAAKASMPPRAKAGRGWFSAAPTMRLRPDSAILIYGPENDISTKTMEEALRIRGFSQGVVIPVESGEQFQELGMTEALKSAGLVDAKGNATLPFISVDGELYSADALAAELSKLPLTNVRERETPYIVVYGITGCPYTKAGQDELDAAGIPYEFRDVNDPRYRPHFKALLYAYDFKYIYWPVLDINGRMFSKPSIEVVRSNYR